MMELATDSKNIVWITGGSSGIGRALVDSVPWRLTRTINISRSAHPLAENLQLDISNPSSWSSVEDSLHETLRSGAYDRAVFIHSAASLAELGFAGEVPIDRYSRQVLLNAAAPLVLGAAFIGAVEKWEVRSDLVMLTSGAANQVSLGWSTYGPAKAAMNQWVKTAAKEREQRGSACRVIAISPGPTDTDMQATIRSSEPHAFPRSEEFARLHIEGKLTAPAAIAASVWEIVASEPPAGEVYDVRPS